MLHASNVFFLLTALVTTTFGHDDIFSKVVVAAEKAVVEADNGETKKAVADVDKTIALVGSTIETEKAAADVDKTAVALAENAIAPKQADKAVGAPPNSNGQTNEKFHTQATLAQILRKHKEETTQAVVEAVSEAEQKPESTEDKKAEAVAEATMDVIKAESSVEKNVSQAVLDAAKDEARVTFEELDKTKIGTKAAADAAAKVAIAVLDTASHKQVNAEVETNAEEAAAAAGNGVSSHPTDLSGALSDAISTISKEEVAGAVDVTQTKAEKQRFKAEEAKAEEAMPKEGIVAKSEAAVSKIPAMADSAIEDAQAYVGGSTSHAGLVIVVFLAVIAVLGQRVWKENVATSPYMKALASMREEESGMGRSRDVEFGQYSEFR